MSLNLSTYEKTKYKGIEYIQYTLPVLFELTALNLTNNLHLLTCWSNKNLLHYNKLCEGHTIIHNRWQRGGREQEKNK
jgi:N-dimethylarginine dimethylaminohydrolase